MVGIMATTIVMIKAAICVCTSSEISRPIPVIYSRRTAPTRKEEKEVSFKRHLKQAHSHQPQHADIHEGNKDVGSSFPVRNSARLTVEL